MATQPEHTNRLAREKSPYLLQHAHNPVDWFPWGEEAFAKARTENKPIFLSIGYSTCHWCHVMAHESFENDETAALMNREFVNVKVDREERPDVDRVHMTFVQATAGHGGWPMSVWLTPDRQPFIGGTYFPPEDRYGHPGFRKILTGIAQAWRDRREQIVAQGQRMVEALREAQAAPSDSSAGALDTTVLDRAFDQLARTFDPEEGGFGSAPKFPRPSTFNFLNRYYARRANDASGQRALEITLFTLRKMAAGGMHDHLGGGFHRYSVDRYWHVPHFEKMLYDQAQLATAYLEAFQIKQDPQFCDVVRDILEYVARDMTSPDGGFFSAEDADSPIAVAAEKDGDAQRAPLQKTAEGAFYVWSEPEIDQALGIESEIFKFHYGVQPDGNAPEGADPHGEFDGKNILIERHSAAEVAEHFQKTEAEVLSSLARGREKLFGIRSKRPRPHLDDKIITAWNGLMISAFARAGAILGDARYIGIGARAAKFLRTELYDQANKLLFRSYRDGRSQIAGFADDYAFVIQALLDLSEAGFDVSWIKFAVELQETQDRLFFDEKSGGYFSTSGQDEHVFLRMKDDNDGAEPAASSVAALNLLRLGQLVGRSDWIARGQKTIEGFAPTLSAYPSAMPQMLVALDCSLAPPQQIVIAGAPDNAGTKALLAEVHRHFLPNKILLLADGGVSQQFFGASNEAIRAMSKMGGEPAAYVCESFICQAPVTEVSALGDLLRTNFSRAR